MPESDDPSGSPGERPASDFVWPPVTGDFESCEIVPLDDGWDGLRAIAYRDVEMHVCERVDDTQPDGLIQRVDTATRGYGHGEGTKTPVGHVPMTRGGGTDTRGGRRAPSSLCTLSAPGSAVHEGAYAWLAVAAGLACVALAYVSARAAWVDAAPVLQPRTAAIESLQGVVPPVVADPYLQGLTRANPDMALARGSENDRWQAAPSRAHALARPSATEPEPIVAALSRPVAVDWAVTPLASDGSAAAPAMSRAPVPVAVLTSHESAVPTEIGPYLAASDSSRADDISPRPATPRAMVPEEERIRSTLTQFRTAYSRLDAHAARQVWPSVDVRALTRAFDGLKEQALLFDRCDLSVNGAEASAACSGRTTYVPRVGSPQARTDRREWNFRLKKVDEVWTIASANGR